MEPFILPVDPNGESLTQWDVLLMIKEPYQSQLKHFIKDYYDFQSDSQVQDKLLKFNLSKKNIFSIIATTKRIVDKFVVYNEHDETNDNFWNEFYINIEKYISIPHKFHRRIVIENLPNVSNVNISTLIDKENNKGVILLAKTTLPIDPNEFLKDYKNNKHSMGELLVTSSALRRKNAKVFTNGIITVIYAYKNELNENE